MVHFERGSFHPPMTREATSLNFRPRDVPPRSHMDLSNAHWYRKIAATIDLTDRDPAWPTLVERDG